MNLLPGIVAHAIVSPCGTYRYALGRYRTGGGIGTVTWVMLNPSTADAETDDPTLRAIQKFSFDRWGYGGLTVVNLYAFRTPQPRDLVKAHLLGTDVIGPDNRQALEECTLGADLVMAAWGAHPMADARGKKVRSVLEMVHGHRLHHLGLTAGGFPKHPLARGKHRIPDDQEPILWT